MAVGLAEAAAEGSTPPGRVPMASGLKLAAVATPFASRVRLTGLGAFSSAPQPRFSNDADSRAAMNVNRLLPVVRHRESRSW